jgi:hypothetical protein
VWIKFSHFRVSASNGRKEKNKKKKKIRIYRETPVPKILKILTKYEVLGFRYRYTIII